MSSPSCKTCKFFFTTIELKSDGIGLCRRKPPQICIDNVTRFPVLKPEGWCGEYFSKLQNLKSRK